MIHRSEVRKFVICRNFACCKCNTWCLKILTFFFFFLLFFFLQIVVGQVCRQLLNIVVKSTYYLLQSWKIFGQQSHFDRQTQGWYNYLKALLHYQTQSYDLAGCHIWYSVSLVSSHSNWYSNRVVLMSLIVDCHLKIVKGCRLVHQPDWQSTYLPPAVGGCGRRN